MNHYHRLDLVLSFYRTERGAEVDCIIETPAGKILAIEIKSTVKEKVPKAQLILGCRVERAQVIKDVKVLPWQEALDYIHREA